MKGQAEVWEDCLVVDYLVTWAGTTCTHERSS